MPSSMYLGIFALCVLITFLQSAFSLYVTNNDDDQKMKTNSKIFSGITMAASLGFAILLVASPSFRASAAAGAESAKNAASATAKDAASTLSAVSAKASERMRTATKSAAA